jgi:hypothetical protein
MFSTISTINSVLNIKQKLNTSLPSTPPDILWYKFNNLINSVDGLSSYTTNINNSIISGNLSLSGSSYVIVNKTINLGYTFSLSFWVNYTTYTTSGAITFLDANGIARLTIMASFAQNDIVVCVPSYNGTTINTGYGSYGTTIVGNVIIGTQTNPKIGSGDGIFNSTFTTNKFIHLAIVFSAQTTVSYYVNGNNNVGKKINNLTTANFPQTTIQRILIGNSYNNAGYFGAGSCFMTGIIDDFRLYSTALTSEQINTIYNNGPL